MEDQNDQSALGASAKGFNNEPCVSIIKSSNITRKRPSAPRREHCGSKIHEKITKGSHEASATGPLFSNGLLDDADLTPILLAAQKETEMHKLRQAHTTLLGLRALR